MVHAGTSVAPSRQRSSRRRVRLTRSLPRRTPSHRGSWPHARLPKQHIGSWKHLPKDLIIGVWGGAPREKSLHFFAEQGFKTLVACYYDADDLRKTKDWMEAAERPPNVRGFIHVLDEEVHPFAGVWKFAKSRLKLCN